jgi:SpoIIAA-like
MIRLLGHSHDHILGFEVSGKVSHQEQQRWTQHLADLLEQHDQVCVMLVLSEDARWGDIVGLEDIKWVLTHMKSFSRVAVVSSNDTWKWLTAVDAFFAKWVGIDEKYFDLNEIDQAWQWLQS